MNIPDNAFDLTTVLLDAKGAEARAAARVLFVASSRLSAINAWLNGDEQALRYAPSAELVADCQQALENAQADVARAELLLTAESEVRA